MSKKQHFFRRLSRDVKMQRIFCIISVTLIVILYFIGMEWIGRQYELLKTDFTFICQVDEVAYSAGELELTGFCFKLNEDADKNAFDLILYDLDEKKGHYVDIEKVMREDVNEYFLCEYDYTNSGFRATMKVDLKELAEKKFEVLVRPKESKYAYMTGIYLVDGEISYADPRNYTPLDVEGTDLEQVVEEGILRVYRSDVGMYVYQYNGDLYWIADGKFEFGTDRNTCIQYQLDTTQIDKLPEYRLKNGWYWDDIGVYFEKEEIKSINTGKYRVAKKSIPSEYSIRRIWTGYYSSEGWSWLQEFLPYYDFTE